VRHVQVAIRPEGQRANAVELAGLLAGASPRANKSAFLVELGDPLILPKLRNVVTAVRILHGVADVSEPGGRISSDLWAHRSEHFAGRRIDTQATVGRIADGHVAVAVDAEAAGPALTESGRRPRNALIVAVAVVDLDAGREIDDE